MTEKNSTNMKINNEKGYKIVEDNLGEYSILRADDAIVSTEIQDIIFAESVLDELNELHEEKEYWKQVASQNSNEINVLEHKNNVLRKENQELKSKLTYFDVFESNRKNQELKSKLTYFDVFESNRIKGAVVTNEEYSVTLHNNNEAYMVCNMINRFIQGVKK